MIVDPHQIAEFKEELEKALDDRNIEKAVSISKNLSFIRNADILSEAPREIILPVIRAMKPDAGGQILGNMPPALVAELLEEASEEESASTLSDVPIDRAVDIFKQLSEDRRQSFLDSISGKDRERLLMLSGYEEGTAGSVMTVKFVAIRSGSTIEQTLMALESAPQTVEANWYVYVVDDQNRLSGVISRRELIKAPRDGTVENSMIRDVVAVQADTDAQFAAGLLRNRGFRTLPVIDDSGQLVGVISVDVAFDVLRQSMADQFVKMGAGSIEESFFTTPMGSVKMRLPWMGANIFLNLGAVFVISYFEDTIAQVALLAVFLPMITDMGGNVGIQALSVAIRSIALGEVRLQEFWKATRKEILIGLVNGLALGLLFMVVAIVLKGNMWLGLVAGTALACNVFLAGVIGGTLPFIIKRLGKDPAMMTGPILTTVTDITGVTIYLGLSTLFLVNILG